MGRPRRPWTPKTPAQGRLVQRVAGYTRVSTGEQAETGYGLAAQQNAIELFCAAGGYELIAIYEDAGLSGTLGAEERPGLAGALAAAQAGKFDALVTKALDRIGRRPRVAIEVFEVLDRAGVQFISIVEPHLSSELLRGLFAGIAADERAKILQRTSEGRQAKARSGGYCGGRVPYGFRLSGSHKQAQFVIEPHEADVVRRIFAARAAGKTYCAIADQLNAAGIPAPRGGLWRPGGVHGIVNNPVYAGLRRWREGGSEIIVPAAAQAAIVDVQVFRRLQGTDAA